MSTTVYENMDVIPLQYSRINPNGGLVTGLAVSVVVRNTKGVVLLASTPLVETVAGSGLYGYDWTHNLPNGGSCVASYTVGTRTVTEYFTITYPSGGSAR